MKTAHFIYVCLIVAGVTVACSNRLTGAAVPRPALAWDAESKEYTSKPGERYANFSFAFTNTSANEVAINSAKSTCFCTVAKLPKEPWPIPAGSNGAIEVTMDLAGKHGTIMKAVIVDTTAGRQTLMVKTTIAPALAAGDAAMKDADRLKNMQTAMADRQAVFKKAECASCHADPAKGKVLGQEVYAAVCSSCHDSPHRATSVPDLHALPHPTDAAHWEKWIRYGRAGSMMPAFAQAEGGPLNEVQIGALTNYLARTIPSRPATNASAPSNPTGGFTVPVAR